MDCLVSVIIQIDTVDAIHVLVVDMLAHPGQDSQSQVAVVNVDEGIV